MHSLPTYIQARTCNLVCNAQRMRMFVLSFRDSTVQESTPHIIGEIIRRRQREAPPSGFTELWLQEAKENTSLNLNECRVTSAPFTSTKSGLSERDSLWEPNSILYLRLVASSFQKYSIIMFRFAAEATSKNRISTAVSSDYVVIDEKCS